MFRDEHKATVWNEVRQQDIRAFAKWLTPEVFILAAVRAKLQAVKYFGENPLCLVNLIWLGLAAALDMGANFSQVLIRTLKLPGTSCSATTYTYPPPQAEYIAPAYFC